MTSHDKQSLYSYFQKHRLLKIFWAVESIIALILIQRTLLGYYQEVIHLVVCIVLLIPVYLLAQTNKTLQAAAYLIFLISVNATYYMWLNYGVFDEAVYFYPAILIMASMLGNKKFFLVFFIFIITSIALNGWFNIQGWYINQQPVIDLSGIVLIIFFIFFISYILWVMAKDFTTVLNELSIENKEVVESKKKIEKLLHHDPLTELPNRVMATEIFERAIARAYINNTMVGVLFIDIDNFKSVNDGLGHEAGDCLLKEISVRLKATLQDSGTLCRLCRLAGDEFVIIVESVKSNQLLATLAQEILNKIKKRFSYCGNEFSVTCSIGISTAPNDSKAYEAIISCADKAMYFSKSRGGNAFHFFNGDMDKEGHDYLIVVNDLRKALEENQFILAYQPKINLLTNQVYGAEALLRWVHPEKGLVPPDLFIPQAEQSGLIIEIGEWVLNQSCITCQSWLALGFDLTIAVNVSSKQFQREGFYSSVQQALSTSQLEADRLELEMTESLLIDNTDILKSNTKSIRALGVKFSIDDFGTGYSNLGYLKAFDIEYLKIDRSFVTDMESNCHNKTLVNAIIKLAHGLEIESIAEGIETAEAASMLADLKCNYAQGYYWSKPLVNEEFIEFIKSYSVSKIE